MIDLSPEQIERVRQYVENLKNASRRAESVAPCEPEHYGYIVRLGCFETFVGWREASSVFEAKTFALSEKLQSWYMNQFDYENAIQNNSVVGITHKQYCDWLRSKS